MSDARNQILRSPDLHNETGEDVSNPPTAIPSLLTPFSYPVNIHTHLLGSLYYFHLLLLLPSPSRPSNLHPLPPLRFGHASSLAIPHLPQHKISLALSIFLISAVGCLGLSAHFHAVQCRTKEVCERAHRGDYVGGRREMGKAIKKGRRD